MLTKVQGLIAFCQVFVVISGLYLIVGLIKPRWVWLGDQVPGRQVIVMISLAMFMASWTGYSMLSLKPSAERRVEQEKAKQAQAAATAVPVEAGKPAAVIDNKPAGVTAAPTEQDKPVVAAVKPASQPASPKKAKTKSKKSAESAAH